MDVKGNLRLVNTNVGYLMTFVAFVVFSNKFDSIAISVLN